jgi:hypothetical protein
VFVSDVQALLDRLMQPVQAKLAEVSHDANMLKRYVIATPEKRRTLSGMFQDVEHRLASANTYRSGVQLMLTLSQVQQDLRGIYDQFYKQYDIGTRDYVAICRDQSGQQACCMWISLRGNQGLGSRQWCAVTNAARPCGQCKLDRIQP